MPSFNFESCTATLNNSLITSRYVDGSKSPDIQEFREITSDMWSLFNVPTFSQSAGALVLKYGDSKITVCANVSRNYPKPLTVYVASYAPEQSEESTCFGAIQGNHLLDHPFVGYIETKIEFRGCGYANKLVSCMNLLSHVIYEEPLTSGPESYLSKDGYELAMGLTARYDLSINDDGAVVGRAVE